MREKLQQVGLASQKQDHFDSKRMEETHESIHDYIRKSNRAHASLVGLQKVMVDRVLHV